MFNNDVIKTKDFIRIEMIYNKKYPNMFFNFKEFAIGNEINLHSKQETEEKFVCYVNRNDYSVIEDFFIENFN